MIKNRIYGKTKDISIDELKKKFSSSKLDYIKLALLFGSRATKSKHYQSDYDIAVLLDENINAPWGVVAKAWTDIGEVLDLADYDYDIIDLKSANSFILNNIKEGFIVLKGDKDEFFRLFTSKPTDSK